VQPRPLFKLKKPALQVQMLVAGPVKVQAEFAPQPPLSVRQLLMAAQPRPSLDADANPLLQAQV
jgi:hypothetical protein